MYCQRIKNHIGYKILAVLCTVLGVASGCTTNPEKEDSSVFIDTAEEMTDTATEESLDPLVDLPDMEITQGESRSVFSEELQTEVRNAWLSDDRILVQSADGIKLWTAQENAWLDISTELIPTAFAVTKDDHPIIFVGSQAWTITELGLDISPVSDQFTEDIVSASVDDRGLWIQTDQDVLRYKNGFLRRLTFNDAGIANPIISEAISYTKPAIWIATDSGVARLREEGAYFETEAFLDVASISAMALTKDEELWALDSSGVLLNWSENWFKTTLPISAHILKGNARVDALWLQDDDNTYVLHDQTLHQLDLDKGSLIGVDSIGRAIILTPDGRLLRVSDTPKISIINVPILNFEESTQLYFDPSTWNEVSTLTVFVDEEEVSINENTLPLLPTSFSNGEHNIRAEILYANGETIESIYSFRVGRDTINWEHDIEPINTAKCMRCHGGNTFTVLETKEHWIEQIDKILYNVELGIMPMGADPLATDVIGKIRSWSETGFE